MRKRNCLIFKDFNMSTIKKQSEANFDAKSQGGSMGFTFLNLDQINFAGKQNGLGSLNSVMTNKDFDEISYEKKYGEGKACGAYTSNLIRGEPIVYDLLNFIRMNKSFSSSFFYPELYAKKMDSMTFSSPTTMIPYSSFENLGSYQNFDFSIDGIEKSGRLNIRLNERACYVAMNEPGFRFKIDAAYRKIVFRVSYIYKDALQFKDYNITPEIDGDYEIDDQYKAIIIETSNAEAFLALTNNIGNKDYVLKEIKKTFITALKATTDGAALKFIYENAPNFVLKELLDDFKPNELWKHVELLTQYDDDWSFSGWVDGSSALINVFKAFESSYYLVSKFRKDPAFLKRIFNNLDGESLVDNQIMNNRILFASLIHACMVTNVEFKGKQTVLDKTFYLGNGYSIDSDVSFFSDEKEDEFFLKQQKTITSTGTAINANDLSKEEYQSEIKVDTEEGQMYHPLDMVNLVDYSSGFPIHVQVPVIFVKALASEAELKDINRNIRIGFDFLQQ